MEKTKIIQELERLVKGLKEDTIQVLPMKHYEFNKFYNDEFGGEVVKLNGFYTLELEIYEKELLDKDKIK